MRHQIFAIFFLILSACSATTENYFSGDSINPKLIEAPYTQNSKEFNEEIQQIIKLQKHFSLNELELASREKFLRPEIFALYADRELTREEYPKLYRLLDRMSYTSKLVNDHSKEYWNVTRPYLVDKKVNMLITPSPGACYPSGHTTSSNVHAQILGLLIPEKSDDLQKLSKKISQRRILVGMHYPHDIVAGEQLSRLVIGGLMQNKEFLKDFAAAKEEIAQGKNKPKKSAPDQPLTKVENEAKEDSSKLASTEIKAENKIENKAENNSANKAEVKVENKAAESITPNDQALPSN